MLRLDPRSTALVLIDLQHGIVSLPVAPLSGTEVVARCRVLAERFRAAGALVVPVNVGWSKDFADAPRQPVDAAGNHGSLPDDWSTLVDGVAAPGDVCITKRQWGAFTGTELDLQLRRRGITTIVLAGIATNMGVESTARHAWELGYAVVVAEDACSGLAAELHDFAIKHIFPRIARVVQADAVTVAG